MAKLRSMLKGGEFGKDARRVGRELKLQKKRARYVRRRGEDAVPPRYESRGRVNY